MYNVKITMKLSDPTKPSVKYKPVTYTGLFIPKGKQSAASTIEKAVISHFTEKLNSRHPNLVISCKVVATKIKTDFCISE